jgi:hypothetical protein
MLQWLNRPLESYHQRMREIAEENMRQKRYKAEAEDPLITDKISEPKVSANDGYEAVKEITVETADVMAIRI